jgi:hypothetical protein
MFLSGIKRRTEISSGMPKAAMISTDDLDILPRMPSWVTLTPAQTPEDVAFLSGAALATLHLVLGREEVPHALWRDRLSLNASEALMRVFGRSARAGDLRDGVHLLRPGDQPGPAGEVFLHWRRAVERPISVKALHRALPAHALEQIAGWLDAGQGGPVARAAATLETVLADFPRAEAAALILADAALAQALGWEYVVPLLAADLKSRDLRKTGNDLRLACHRAIAVSSGEAVRMAVELTRRVDRLKSVAPTLRAKGAGAAVQMFLTQDAVTPAALPLSDRAARRFCDRLVELGVVRELTGRDTFRLYGV